MTESTKNIKRQIEQLRAEIRRHDYLYYVLNQPEVSDQRYDKLFAKESKMRST